MEGRGYRSPFLLPPSSYWEVEAVIAAVGTS